MKKSMMLFAAIALIFALLPIGADAAKLSDDTLAKKKEGWYVTGLPLVNFSSDDGFGYGVRAYLYFNGQKDDPYYDSTPYFMQLYAQYFATTNGVQYHELNLDMPYIAGTKFRIKSAFVYDADINANFFGLGADIAKSKLYNPGDPTIKYSKYSDYQDFIDDNKKYYQFYKYSIVRPKYYLYLFRDMTDEIKLMAGAEFKYVTIDTYQGEKFKSTIQEPTLLDTTKAFVPGFDGGWTNYARFGIGYDTRDFEPDPNKGIYLDYCFEAANSTLGSEYDFLKNNVGANFFVNPIGKLVLALRLAYTTSSEDIPFYEMNWFGFSLNRREGLGGNRTLRGYKKNRFVGRTMTMGNAEFRWQFYEVTGGGQRFAFKVVGFCDTGNVYDGMGDPFSDPRFSDYHTSYGGGLVIAWNLATIIHVYYGISEEDTGLYVNFEHNF